MANLKEKLAELHAGFRPGARRLSEDQGERAELRAELQALAASRSGEGAGVRVAVRCRPQPESSSAFKITSDAFGRDKVSLRVDAPKEAWEQAGCGEDAPRVSRCNAYFGPESTQEQLFAEAAPVVENVMKGGGNGAVLCYGATDTGKTYTMGGPTEEGGAPQHDSPSSGLVQRTARRIFEYIRDRSLHGDIYAVEASFLQVYTTDGSDELLVDLLAKESTRLEVVPDASNPNTFVCEGLHRAHIRSPDELCEVFAAGQQRSLALEASKTCQASRSHCLFMLMIESMAEQEGSPEPLMTRAKLILADLAGAESPDSTASNAERQQTQGIQHQLASLATIGSPGAGQDSTLPRLLRDCFGCERAQSLVVLSVATVPESLNETARALKFAQQMMAVKSVTGTGQMRTDRKSSTLLQMKQRHSDCLRIMQEKVEDSQSEQTEKRLQMQYEMDELNQRLLTKEKAEKTLEDMRREQGERIDLMKVEMAKTMTLELEKMREFSMQDFNSLKQSVEQHVEQISSSQQQRSTEEHEARVEKLQAELQDSLKGQKSAEDEASGLKVRLASVEERAKMLQARQEELRNERQQFDDERKELRTQSEQQWQKLMSTENEVQRCKMEADAQKGELARATAKRSEDDEAARRDRDAWRSREAEMQQEVQGLQRQLEEAKREAEVQALRSGTEQREAENEMKRQVERLQDEAISKADQLSKAHETCARMEAEKEASRQREEGLRHQSAAEIRQLQEDIDQARDREAELMDMLHDIQNSIINAQNAPGGMATAQMQHVFGAMR